MYIFKEYKIFYSFYERNFNTNRFTDVYIYIYILMHQKCLYTYVDAPIYIYPTLCQELDLTKVNF